MNSIRRQLIAFLLVGLSVLFILSGTMLYLYVRHTLLNQFDEFMLGKAVTFAAASEHDRESVDFELDEAQLPEFMPSKKAEYYQVWNDTGETVARSPSLGDDNLLFVNIPPDSVRFNNVSLPDGRAGRAVTIRFEPRSPGEESRHEDRDEHTEETEPETGRQSLESGHMFTLVMARSREEVNRALMALLSGLCITCLILLGGSACLVRWAVQRGLQPLDSVAAQAAVVDATSLARRFPTDSMPAELHPICSRLNELFERLEISFDRQRRFTSDVAHELRTPIAELRSLAEVGLIENQTDQTTQDTRVYLQDTLDIALQMEQLITVLLEMARCEAGLQTVNLQPLDISKLIEETWSTFSEQAADRQLTVERSLDESVYIKTDPTLMRALLTGLFSNAVTYTKPHGTVRLTAEHTDGHTANITVSNSTDQIERDDLEHLCEPFWRKDDARSDGGHSGVGLSLVAEYARLLDLDINFDMPNRDTFRATLTTTAISAI